MVDPKDDLVAFLRERFDPNAISMSFTPGDPQDTKADGDVRFADPDGPKKYPQVAVVSKDSIVVGGGQTGATGIDAGGGGAVQDVVYLVQVDCWGGPEDDDAYADGSHPDVVATELGEEVARICRAGTDCPAGYEWMFCDPPSEADDDEASPTEHREIVRVRMKVTYTP